MEVGLGVYEVINKASEIIGAVLILVLMEVGLGE